MALQYSGSREPMCRLNCEVVIAAGPPAHPVDQDRVGVVADGEVRGVPGGLGEPPQVRRRDLTQFQRAEYREPQVEDPGAEAVLAGGLVLVEIAERGQGRDVPVGGAAGEGEHARQLTDPEFGPLGSERAEDGEAALQGLRKARAAFCLRHVPNTRTVC